MSSQVSVTNLKVVVPLMAPAQLTDLGWPRAVVLDQRVLLGLALDHSVQMPVNMTDKLDFKSVEEF